MKNSLSILLFTLILLAAACKSDQHTQNDPIEEKSIKDDNDAASKEGGPSVSPIQIEDLPTHEEQKPARAPIRPSTAPGNAAIPTTGSTDSLNRKAASDPGLNSTASTAEESLTPAGLTEEDKRNLEGSFGLEPTLAFIHERTTFKNVSPEARKWHWQWDLDGDNAWDSGRERISTFTFTELGKRTIRLQAKSKEFTLPFQQDILVTVSRNYLEQQFMKLKSSAKKADESEADQDIRYVEKQFTDVKKYLSQSVKIKLPKQPGFLSFDEFADILIADIGFEQVFSGLDNHTYDPKTGMITVLNFK